MGQLQSSFAPQLTDQLLPTEETAPDDATHGFLSWVLCSRRENLQKMSWLQWILVATAILAFIYFLVHWFVLTRAEELFPEQELLNGTAVFGVVVLILVVLRGSMSAAAELLAARKEMSVALNQANQVQERTTEQLDTLQVHLDSAEERAREQAEAREREAQDFEKKLHLVTDLRDKMGEDLNSWLGQLSSKTGELNQQAQMLARITWMQAKSILVQQGHLDTRTGVIKSEGLETLQAITGPSSDLRPFLQDAAHGQGTKQISEEMGLQLFEAKVAGDHQLGYQPSGAAGSSSRPPAGEGASSPRVREG